MIVYQIELPRLLSSKFIRQPVLHFETGLCCVGLTSMNLTQMYFSVRDTGIPENIFRVLPSLRS